MLKRLVQLGVLAGAGYLAYTLLRKPRPEPESADGPWGETTTEGKRGGLADVAKQVESVARNVTGKAREMLSSHDGATAAPEAMDEAGAAPPAAFASPAPPPTPPSVSASTASTAPAPASPSSSASTAPSGAATSTAPAGPPAVTSTSSPSAAASAASTSPAPASSAAKPVTEASAPAVTAGPPSAPAAGAGAQGVPREQPVTPDATAKDAQAEAGNAAGGPVKGNIRNDGTKIYHMPGDPAYESTQAEQTFATWQEAEAAGFRRARHS